jgi:hypothetical protein
MRHEKSYVNGCSVSVDTAKGTLAIRGANGAIGPSTTALLIEDGDEINVLRRAKVVIGASTLEVRFRVGALDGRLRFGQRDPDWLTIQASLTNRSRRDVRVESFDFLRFERARGFGFGGDPRDLRLLSNPRGMGPFAGTRALLPTSRDDLYDLGPSRSNGGMPYERWNQSWMLTAIWDRRSRRGVVIGAAQPMRDSLQFITEGEAFRARFFPDSRLVAPGATVRSAEAQIDLARPPREGIEAYAELNRQPLRVKDLSRYAGWNSFDYYLNTERLSDIVENADAIRADPALGKPLKWICVDSGWEYRWGEYVAVEHRFPGGLPNLVKQLKRRGFQTGIWTAPLMVERWSTRTTRWDPEILVRDEAGHFMPVFNDNCFIVDPTHPAGERYLRELYRGLRAAGIRYFKCDFLENGFSHARRRFKRHLSITEVNRRVLEIIREAIGPDSFLLACIAAPEAAIGIADAMRISGDMHNVWSNAQFSALNTAWRWWMHGTLIWNDPDMIPIRGPQTATEPLSAYRVPQPFKMYRGDSGPLFDRREAELWMAFCLLSGGLFSLCDRMTKLNAVGRRIARIAVENLSQVAAKPIDFYEPGLPALYLQQDRPSSWLGVFNWHEQPRAIRVHTDGLLDIPLGTVLHEVWSGKNQAWNGPFTVRLQPHECRFFRFETPRA